MNTHSLWRVMKETTENIVGEHKNISAEVKEHDRK
jgi:hypothetical protein